MSRLAAIALVVALLSPVGVCAAPQDATARALLAAWEDQDPSARLAAELIAGAFASGLSWGGKLDGKEVFCPPDGLTGRQIMTAFEQFIGDKPDMADKPYGVAMAESLRRTFPCGPPCHVEVRPDVVKLAKALARKKPKGGRLSLRAISAEMAARGVLNERGKQFNPKSVSVLLAS